MLRLLFLALQIGVLVAVSVWVANHPGFVSISWLGYDVRVHVGLVLLALAVSAFFLFLFFKILTLPSWWRRWRERRAQDKGMRALIRGVGALAAGDAAMATRLAGQARYYLPQDKGMVVLLEGQAARLRGDDLRAQQAFEALLADKDGAFLGLRGLMEGALAHGDDRQALTYARQALTLHRQQPGLIKMVYRLELKNQDWDAAEKTLKRAVKRGAVEKAEAALDRAALALYEAEKAANQVDERGALAAAKKAWRLAPGFIPAALAVARAYQKAGKRRAAVGVVEKAWRGMPHPELAALWAELAPKRRAHDSTAGLRWALRLVALAPDSAESMMAVARAAIEDGLWGEALEHLKKAEALEPSAPLYRLWAEYEEARGRKDSALEWREKAAIAPAGKVWVCRQTGRIYERWTPIAAPHGAFNTMIWAVPSVVLSGGDGKGDLPREGLLSPDMLSLSEDC